uniref:SFRICE_005086 n=1 Tax=Spodoptera frugiperda TaxID=7108 RepID=A0A2H1VE43_SPOFR
MIGLRKCLTRNSTSFKPYKRLIFMSSSPRLTTRRLSRCYWRLEFLCLESCVLSGARDDVGSLDSFLDISTAVQLPATCDLVNSILRAIPYCVTSN